ncbi:MAG: caspase family protein [Candidatus Pacebacteria bacterium]|nr:caspase family protein [Candidatus Paceibacterota bacterium]
MRKALLIGIDDYPGLPLTGCVNDASILSGVIEKNGDGSPNFSVRLKNNIPKKSELKGEIVELFDGEGDVALLYFSGHGYLDITGGYIVTPDYEKHDEGVSMEEILTLANKSKIKNKIIILDCCHSGSFGSPEVSGGHVSQISEGIVVLTASLSTETAAEIDGHGVFTGLLLDAIQGGAADLMGRITPGGIYAYIDQALGPWDQRPVFKTNVTNFTSLRTVTPPVSPDILRKIVEYFPTPEAEYLLDPSFEDTNVDIAKPENVAIFKNLQKFQGVNLVRPVGEEYMYFAAQNSKSCKLTALGYHYWRLVTEGRI